MVADDAIFMYSDGRVLDKSQTTMLQAFVSVHAHDEHPLTF